MNLQHWTQSETTLIRVFQFKNFVQAIAFVNEVAKRSEAINHHPDIEIFSYNKVRITLSTHDAGNKVTEKDFQLAQQIDFIFVEDSKL